MRDRLVKTSIYRPDRVIKTSKKEIQAQLDAINSNLDEQTKSKYPAYSYERIKEDFPDSWVAVLETRLDPSEARVFLASPEDRVVFDKEFKNLLQRYPNLPFFVFFTGPYNFGGDLIIV